MPGLCFFNDVFQGMRNLNIKNFFRKRTLRENLVITAAFVLFELYLFAGGIAVQIFLKRDLSSFCASVAVMTIWVWIIFCALQLRNKFLINLFLLLLATGLALSLGEIAARALGYTSWREAQGPGSKVTLQSSSRKFFKYDPVLGPVCNEGYYRFTIGDQYSFSVTNDAEGLRITKPAGPKNSSRSPKNEIWIFGDSFSYGWGVNDDQTFSWLLQERFPNDRIINFSQPSFSTVQSFLQFQEALKTKPAPKIVIMAYVSFHDARNVLAREWKKSLNMSGPSPVERDIRPYAFWDHRKRLNYGKIEIRYQRFPGTRYSAFMDAMEDIYNAAEKYFLSPRQITEAVFEDFERLAEKNGIELAVAGLDIKSKEMLKELKKKKIPTLGIFLDERQEKYHNAPYDGHPNPLAHQYYAKQIENFLRRELH